ncbi:MAG: hypothetical protein J6P28_03410 [Treponema sp.]|nr:hypothetical protein [Treponema sp.]
MTKRQVLDLKDDLTDLNNNLITLVNGVEFDDRKMVKPLEKISNELNSFIAKLEALSWED